MKIVFFGTPPFAAHILQALINSDHNLCAIVTQPDRPKGRSKKPLPPAVKEKAETICPDIPLFQPEKASTDTFAEKLKSFSPDLFVVVAYGEIMRQNLLDVPKLLPLNIHASLLPKYRGAAPIQRAIMGGERKTGITLIEMVKKMDAGDMLAKAELEIPKEMNGGELTEALQEVAAGLLLKTLDNWENIKKIPQDEARATLAPKILAEDRQISFNQPAEEIHNQIRALSPLPGAYCQVLMGDEKKRMIVRRATEVEGEGAPGQVLCYDQKKLVVACKQGALSLEQIQLEGKKNMSISAFVSGVPVPPKFTLS